MCGRFAINEEHATNIGCYLNTEISPQYNIAPSQKVTVLFKDGDLCSASMRWGFLPAWKNTGFQLKPQINARAETVANKPTFRESFSSKRVARHSFNRSITISRR